MATFYIASCYWMQIDLLWIKNFVLSYNVLTIIDKLFNVPSKIVHIAHGKFVRDHVEAIKSHFQKFGAPIMMGGDQDASSKGIFGIASNKQDHFLLVIDPHYYGKPVKSSDELINQSWIRWTSVDDFMEGSFYNLCMPQYSTQ